MTVYITATFKELTRKRVFLVTLMISALFLLLFAFGVRGMASIAEQNQVSPASWLMTSLVLTVLGLFFAQFLSAFFVFFTAMGTVTGEQENGLLLAVAARPIPRWKLYLAKWLGHAVWIAGYSSALFLTIIGTLHAFAGLPVLAADVLRGLGLFVWMPLLLLTITMLGSVYLPMLGNGICAALLYGFALFNGLIEGVSSYGQIHPAIEKSTFLTGLLIPTDLVYRRSLYEVLGGSEWASLTVADMGPFSITSVPSNAFLLYTAGYAGVLLLLGCRAFSRKDL